MRITIISSIGLVGTRSRAWLADFREFQTKTLGPSGRSACFESPKSLKIVRKSHNTHKRGSSGSVRVSAEVTQLRDDRSRVTMHNSCTHVFWAKTICRLFRTSRFANSSVCRHVSVTAIGENKPSSALLAVTTAKRRIRQTVVGHHQCVVGGSYLNNCNVYGDLIEFLYLFY